MVDFAPPPTVPAPGAGCDRPAAADPDGVGDILALRCEEDPEAVAIVHGDGGRSVSWFGVAEAAAAIGRRLGGPDGALPPGSPVGMMLADPALLARSSMATMAAGYCAAPLDPRLSPTELAYALDAIGIRHLMVDGDAAWTPEHGAVADRYGVTRWEPGGDTREGGSSTVGRSGASPLPDDRRATDPGGVPGLVLATSGTTGSPKAVTLTQRQLLYVARAVAAHHGLGPSDRCYCPLPLFHVNAQVVGLLAALVSGGSVVVEPRARRQGVWEVVERTGATWCNFVPAVLAIVADLPPPPAVVRQRVRFARSASAPLPEAVRRRFESVTGITVLETYGMTEAASQITANPLDPAERRPGSVGRPVGVELRVVATGDADGGAPARVATVRPMASARQRRAAGTTEAAGGGTAGPGAPDAAVTSDAAGAPDAPGPAEPETVGMVGMVEIRGPGVVPAYGAPGRPGRPCVDGDGWLATGDLGYLDDAGFLYLVGRADDVVNRAGEKVYPAEVEAVLLADVRVTAAAVVGRPHDVLGQEPVAFVVVDRRRHQADAVVADLHQRCRAALRSYKRPVAIEVVDALPASATGKVSRRAVARGLLAALPSTDGAAAGSATGQRRTGPDAARPAQAGARPRRHRMVSPSPAGPGPQAGEARRRAMSDLHLPVRPAKPRSTGRTMVIDPGMPTASLDAALASAADLVDVVKLGWGTALCTPDVEAKLRCLRGHGVEYYFGGTLFEAFAARGLVDDYLRLCEAHGCTMVEISNGTIPLDPADKARAIAAAARRFTVLSEVGSKDPALASAMTPEDVAAAVARELSAGAALVVTEARESGRSGICTADGTARDELVEAAIDGAGGDCGRLLFEAPTKALQVHFLRRVGPDANLGNVAAADVVGVESLRLGLRFDTMVVPHDRHGAAVRHA